MNAATPVVGRFAPTPSGPLHFGSVVTAVASWLDVRARGGRWLLRIDDLDPPRVVAGAEDAILATLEALALTWDGEVLRQSSRGAAYAAAFEALRTAGRVYPCACSRREIGRGPYPGTCRQRVPPPTGRVAWRLRVGGEAAMRVDDVVQGEYCQDVAAEGGDFVLRRADGVYAYHLAVVVDDAWQGVTDVTRGVDLLDSTPRQVLLQHLLGLPTPRYAHLPVVLDAVGDKLSKQTHAPPVGPQAARLAAWQALDFLGLEPPAALRGEACAALLAWAVPRWRLTALDPAPRPYAFAA